MLVACFALALPLSSQATLKPKPLHPTTGPAQHVGESTVALEGSVNPRGQETTCYFQYGTTASYGAQTPTAAVGEGTVAVKVNQPVTGLLPGTVYHYRMVAMNASETIDGQDRTFTTKRIPLKFSIVKTSNISPFGSPFTLAGTLSGTGGADRQVVLQTSAFPFLSGFADSGAPASTNAEGGFSLRVSSLSSNAELRVRTLEAVPTYSPIVTVHVAVRVTLHAHRAAQGVLLSGTVTPAEVGAPIVFQWMKSGRPANVGGTVVRRVSANASRFSAIVDIRHGGYYRALARVSNGKQVSGFSRTVLLRATVVHKTRRARR